MWRSIITYQQYFSILYFIISSKLFTRKNNSEVIKAVLLWQWTTLNVFKLKILKERGFIYLPIIKGFDFSPVMLAHIKLLTLAILLRSFARISFFDKAFLHVFYNKENLIKVKNVFTPIKFYTFSATLKKIFAAAISAIFPLQATFSF